MDAFKTVVHDWAPLATFVLALAALLSSIAALSQLVLARRQFARTHRPELIVPFCEVAAEAGLGARFTVVNKGASEARIVGVKAAILLTDPPDVGDYLLDIEIGPRTLASGERMVGEVFTDSETAGSLYFFRGTPIRCIGRIAYTDANGRLRETGFGRVYDATGKRWVAEAGSQHDYAY